VDAQNIIIAFLVIGARLLVPLLIPRIPLPAILACLIIDAVDQTIFQKYTTINLDNYQSYDKALDIYYLSIAYLSTFRNWTNEAAFKISQFLFYYRMVGDALFQITDIRAFLFIFPNTFEYFFIFYSVVALRWNPKKLSTKFLIGVAAFIWIFIKLPQEYWIHIAQIDTTDFIKENIFHVPVTTTFPELIAMFPWIIPVSIGVVLLIIVATWYLIKKLPPADLRFTFASRVADRALPVFKNNGFKNMLKGYRNDYLEKIAFVSLVLIIFSYVFPNFRGTNIQIIFGVVITILVNAIFSYLLLNSSRFNSKLISNFFLMYVVNTWIMLIYAKIVAGFGNPVSFLTIMYFAYVMTLITVLYDRFKPYYLERFNIKR
jgi:hypothetical protein